MEQLHALQQVEQSELHGVQHEGVQHEVGAQQDMQEAQFDMQDIQDVALQRAHDAIQHIPQDGVQDIESNALVHP